MQPTTNIVVELGPADSGVSECVTTQELYDHLSLNTGLSAVEDLLARDIKAAHKQFEFHTDGRILLPTAFAQHLTAWPKTAIQLHRGAVLEVTSVTYYDDNDEEQELADAVAELASIPALVYTPTFTWPTLSTRRLRPITVEFVAGWESPEAVPADVKVGILELAGRYYLQREAYSEVKYNEVPMSFERFCAQYRTGLSGW